MALGARGKGEREEHGSKGRSSVSVDDGDRPVAVQPAWLDQTEQTKTLFAFYGQLLVVHEIPGLHLLEVRELAYVLVNNLADEVFVVNVWLIERSIFYQGGEVAESDLVEGRAKFPYLSTCQIDANTVQDVRTSTTTGVLLNSNNEMFHRKAKLQAQINDQAAELKTSKAGYKLLTSTTSRSSGSSCKSVDIVVVSSDSCCRLKIAPSPKQAKNAAEKSSATLNLPTNGPGICTGTDSDVYKMPPEVILPIHAAGPLIISVRHKERPILIGLDFVIRGLPIASTDEIQSTSMPFRRRYSVNRGESTYRGLQHSNGRLRRPRTDFSIFCLRVTQARIS
ncbi:hypothetical protein B0H19DRAFT_1236378 [Mycena capillaripes]|nr:hypothetical protein B0H19DRAFT_1236378 [Mycena capillaripes]